MKLLLFWLLTIIRLSGSAPGAGKGQIAAQPKSTTTPHLPTTSAKISKRELITFVTLVMKRLSAEIGVLILNDKLSRLNPAALQKLRNAWVIINHFVKEFQKYKDKLAAGDSVSSSEQETSGSDVVYRVVANPDSITLESIPESLSGGQKPVKLQILRPASNEYKTMSSVHYEKTHSSKTKKRQRQTNDQSSDDHISPEDAVQHLQTLISAVLPVHDNDRNTEMIVRLSELLIAALPLLQELMQNNVANCDQGFATQGSPASVAPTKTTDTFQDDFDVDNSYFPDHYSNAGGFAAQNHNTVIKRGTYGPPAAPAMPSPGAILGDSIQKIFSSGITLFSAVMAASGASSGASSAQQQAPPAPAYGPPPPATTYG
ncbi:hypothetical protein TKK_0000630 [Trichogramma kaykai]|uniref:Uncharacterized protein n=1 Tax=Trichogramma kaykai TaxID=54128 RepID=A0ABD2VZJ3_9HYME